MATTRRFFTAAPVINGTIGIDGEEYFHLKNVNRARTGDSIEVIDGAGVLYTGKIDKMGREEAVVIIEQEKRQDKPGVKITIVPSLTKKKGMGVCIEKLTEIGVDEIRPVIFSRTDEVYSESQLKKWKKVAAQSLKVNKKLWITDIYPPVQPAEILTLPGTMQTRVLLDISGEGGVSGLFQYPSMAVVGPPGGLTDEERELFISGGFRLLKINENNLKTETAAIAIASLLSFPAAI